MGLIICVLNMSQETTQLLGIPDCTQQSRNFKKPNMKYFQRYYYTSVVVIDLLSFCPISAGEKIDEMQYLIVKISHRF